MNNNMKTHTFMDFVLPARYYAQTFYVPSHLILITPPYDSDSNFTVRSSKLREGRQPVQVTWLRVKDPRHSDSRT